MPVWVTVVLALSLPVSGLAGVWISQRGTEKTAKQTLEGQRTLARDAERRDWRRRQVALCLLLGVLVGCSQTNVVTCSPPATPSPGAQATWSTSTGPVSIALDRSFYAPAAGMQVRVVNGLAVTLLYQGIDICSPFVFERLVNGVSKGFFSTCLNGMGDKHSRPQGGTLMAGGHFLQSVLAPTGVGTYRLDLSYVGYRGLPQDRGVAHSFAFQVCSCGVCS
jgi:hypothetical protein